MAVTLKQDQAKYVVLLEYFQNQLLNKNGEKEKNNE